MRTGDLKILFASNDSIALPVLNALNQEAVLTIRTTESGRKKRINPIALWAEQNNKKIHCIDHLMKKEREEILCSGYDMLISFSFSRIFGPKFLSIFPKGCFNIHPSLLPKYRGPSPLQAALLNGDKTTAVVMQTISLKMDEGDIVSSQNISIEPCDDYHTLFEKASRSAVSVVNGFFEIYPKIIFSPQIGEPTYTGLISKSEGKISFSEYGENIERKIKAYSEYPRMRCSFNDQILILQKARFEKAVHSYENGLVVGYKKNDALQIAVNGGFLYVTELQKQGKSLTDAQSFINGNKAIIGQLLKECEA